MSRVLQPDGGFVAVEPAIAAQVALAQAAGAELRTGVTVVSVDAPWQAACGSAPARATSTRARSSSPPDHGSGRSFPACRSASRARSWPGSSRATARCSPAIAFRCSSSKAGTACITASRLHGSPGVKIAKHHHRNQTVDPDRVDRAVSDADEALIRAALADHIPAANGPLVAAKTCLYTVTPDRDFIIDRLPGAPNIIVASPCSGHGFKFAPVIGEILADLAIDGRDRP